VFVIVMVARACGISVGANDLLNLCQHLRAEYLLFPHIWHGITELKVKN
jgi:hypothetical protein